MAQTPLRSAPIVLLMLALLGRDALPSDWPAYKHGPGRSGVTAERLAFPLSLKWVYEPSQPPEPAWPEPGKELHRVDFDYAFQPVAAGGLVYFGSSADDTVRALRADTGELVWRFIADGPVRFAPAIARSRAYVASDDGCLYCLDVKTGRLVWRFRAAPDRDRVIGNGRAIARYPCRSGALVVDSVVYITAGMWPTEGVYVVALDAGTGKELWCNDSSGNIYIDLPHAVASGFSGVAPQGYLVASEDVLLVPTGRSVPAAFDRRTGRLLYYKPEKTHYQGASYGGGVWCTAAGSLYFHTNNRFHNPSEARIGEAEPVVRRTAPPAVQDFLDIEWPTAWRVIGPFPKGKPPLPSQALGTVPDQVTVGGQAYAASDVEAVGAVIDSASGHLRRECEAPLRLCSYAFCGFSGSQAPAWEPGISEAPASGSPRGGSLADRAFPRRSLGTREQNPRTRTTTRTRTIEDISRSTAIRGHTRVYRPRPMVNNACPAPVTVSMADASCYYRRRATPSIQGTDSPWVYSSGLRGRGQIAIDVALRRGLELPTRNAAPAIDGKLDDACWKGLRAVPFANTPFSMLGAAVELRMCRDDENVYFGYHRRPLATARADTDTATLGSSDEIELFVADAGKKVGIRFAIKRNGNAIARFGTVGVSRKTDPNWKGTWQHAVQEAAGGWMAEVALPIRTLTQSGIELKRLQLNGMSQNLTRSGLETIFLTDPSYGAKFASCVVFRRVVQSPGNPPPERPFTVRLHFAATADEKAGQRVFDVLLQGKRVLQDFDVVREAGGPNAAIVREFTGIRASDRVVVDLVPKGASVAPEAQPEICAIELIEETGR